MRRRRSNGVGSSRSAIHTELSLSTARGRIVTVLVAGTGPHAREPHGSRPRSPRPHIPRTPSDATIESAASARRSAAPSHAGTGTPRHEDLAQAVVVVEVEQTEYIFGFEAAHLTLLHPALGPACPLGIPGRDSPLLDQPGRLHEPPHTCI